MQSPVDAQGHCRLGFLAAVWGTVGLAFLSKGAVLNRLGPSGGGATACYQAGGSPPFETAA